MPRPLILGSGTAARWPGLLPRSLIQRDRCVATWQWVLLLCASSVAYVYVSGFVLGAQVVPEEMGWGGEIPELVRDEPVSATSLLVRSDAAWYIEIARTGYGPGSHRRAYFPLYPLVMRGLTAVTGLPLLASGAIISGLAFIASGLLLYAVAATCLDRRHAAIAVTTLSVFPLTFYFIAQYAEATFLVLSLAGVYFAVKGRWVLAGVALCLTGLARPIGWVFIIAYVVEFAYQRDFRRQRIVSFLVGLAVAPLGTVSFLLFLSLSSGTTDAVGYYSRVYWDGWKDYFTWPWIVLSDGVRAGILGDGIDQDWYSRFVARHDLAYVMLGLFLCVVCWFKARPSIAAAFTLAMIVILCAHGPNGHALYSDARRVTSLFPLYLGLSIVLAALPLPIRVLLWSGGAAGLGIAAAWYVSGRFIA